MIAPKAESLSGKARNPASPRCELPGRGGAAAEGNETETELAAILAVSGSLPRDPPAARISFAPVFSHKIIWRADETEVRAFFFSKPLLLFLPCPWLSICKTGSLSRWDSLWAVGTCRAALRLSVFIVKISPGDGSRVRLFNESEI